jgi:hypothetical protein
MRGVRLGGGVGSGVVISVVAGVAVDVPRVPGAIRESPDSAGVARCSAALHAAVGGGPVGTSLRFGKRDRGRCVVGAGHDRGWDVTWAGTAGGLLHGMAVGVVDPHVVVDASVAPRVLDIGHGEGAEVGNPWEAVTRGNEAEPLDG